MTTRFFMAFLDHIKPWNFLLMVIQWNFTFLSLSLQSVLQKCIVSPLWPPFLSYFLILSDKLDPRKGMLMLPCNNRLMRNMQVFAYSIFCKPKQSLFVFEMKYWPRREPIAKQMWREYLNCWVTVLPVWAHKSRIGPTHKFGKYTKSAKHYTQYHIFVIFFTNFETWKMRKLTHFMLSYTFV